MRMKWIVSAMFVLAVVAAGVALAQPPGPGRFGPPGPGPGGFGPGGFGMGGPLMLLRLEQVQKELGITEEQRAKLEEVGRKLMEQGRERFQEMRELRDLPEEQRRARFAELMEQGRQQVEEAIRPILSEDQMKRLKQIELQAALQGPGGVRVLARKDVAAALGLNEAQVEKINQLAERVQEQMREAFRQGGPEQREQMQQKMEQLRAEARAEVEKILTQEQIGKLKELLGAPFRLEMPRGFGFQRGEGRPPEGPRPPEGGRPEGGRRGRARGGAERGQQ